MQEQNDRTCAHSTSCSQCCFDCLFEIFHSCWCHNDIVILLLGLNNAGKSTLLSTIRYPPQFQVTGINLNNPSFMRFFY